MQVTGVATVLDTQENKKSEPKPKPEPCQNGTIPQTFILDLKADDSFKERYPDILQKTGGRRQQHMLISAQPHLR
jgi:hypothetical protein